MNTHLMLDFETLGQTPDTAVLSLGAVLFNQDGILDCQDWVFDLTEQLRSKRSVTSSTIVWWLQQGAKAQEIFALSNSKGKGMREFTPEFLKFSSTKDLRVWGNGATFDVSIIEHLLSQMKVENPWMFWNVRCYRTIKAMFEIEKGKPFVGTKHNALDDAKYQAERMSEFLKANPVWDK